MSSAPHQARSTSLAHVAPIGIEAPQPCQRDPQQEAHHLAAARPGERLIPKSSSELALSCSSCLVARTHRFPASYGTRTEDGGSGCTVENGPRPFKRHRGRQNHPLEAVPSRTARLQILAGPVGARRTGRLRSVAAVLSPPAGSPTLSTGPSPGGRRARRHGHGHVLLDQVVRRCPPHGAITAEAVPPLHHTPSPEGIVCRG
jgi:hypothetical protein